MNRPYLRIIFCLFVGFTLTILLAWWCRWGSLMQWQALTRPLNLSECQKLWVKYAPNEKQFADLSGAQWTKPGSTEISFGCMQEGEQTTKYFGCAVFQYGFPIRALEAKNHYWEQFPNQVTTLGSMPQSQLKQYGWWAPPVSIGPFHMPWMRELPIRPLWTGLITNTIFYAGLAWLCLALLTRIRRRARLDRRRCTHCNYAFHKTIAEGKTQIICSECGSILPTALLERPRQILRWWIMIILLPPLAFVGLFFLGIFSWITVRFRMLDGAPFFTISNLVMISIVIGWLLVLASFSYHDRPSCQRRTLAAIIALLIGPLSYICIFYMVLNFSS